MRDKPPLDEDALRARVGDAWGVRTTAIAFVPRGNDAAASTWRVDTDDAGPLFLKARRDLPSDASLRIPRHLRDRGIDAVVAPLPTRGGALQTSHGLLTLTITPWIDGACAMEVGLTPVQWRAFGATLQAIHETPPPPESPLPAETFVPLWAETVRALDHQIAAGGVDDPWARTAADLWSAQRHRILDLTEHTVAQGARLRREDLPLVLCHADIHTANLLVDGNGALHIVDWDGALQAPRERDLMFMDDAPHFFDGYGDIRIDPDILAYYRGEWAVQEIGDYGERIFLRRDLAEDTRRASADAFADLFTPGDVVEGAEAVLRSG